MLDLLTSLIHFQWGVVGLVCLVGLMVLLVWWHTLLLRGRLADVEERLARLEGGTWPEACRICGCTEDNACEGGCYWVEPGLCSRCAEKYVVLPVEEGGKS